MSSVDGINRPILLAKLIDDSKIAPPPGEETGTEETAPAESEKAVVREDAGSDAAGPKGTSGSSKAIDTFNRWVLGPGVSDHIKEKNDEFVDWSQKQKWYFNYPLGVAYVPTTVLSRTVVPTFISDLYYQPVGSEVMNIANNGTENKLVSSRKYGIELGTDLTGSFAWLGAPEGMVTNLTVNSDSSEYTDGGEAAGKDTNLSLSWQSILTKKHAYDGILPPISSANKIYAGNPWNKWPGDTFRALLRWPSWLNKVSKDATGKWEYLGVPASVILTPIQFIAEDVPNALYGWNLRSNLANDKVRNNPSFYDPSVRSHDLGVDLYWSFGLYMTTSFDQVWGTKEYTLGLPHNYDGNSWSVRIDSPNMLGEEWGIPFFKFYPWVSYKRGREYIETSPGSSLTKEIYPITGDEIIKTLPAHGGKETIEYSKISGGLNADLDIFSEKFKFGMQFSKEQSEMQRSRVTNNYRLVWRSLALNYQLTNNPIMYYDNNTRARESQEKVELEYDPHYKNMWRFLPKASIGHEITKTETGATKNEYTYFKVTFSLGRTVDEAQKKALANTPVKDLLEIEHMAGNNKYALVEFTDLDSQTLRGKFEAALSEALKIITDEKKKGFFSSEKNEEFDKQIREFQKLVSMKGVNSDDSKSEKAKIEEFISGLSGAANRLMADLISEGLKTRFFDALDKASSVLKEYESDRITFIGENTKIFNDQLLPAYKDSATNEGINSQNAIDNKRKIEDLIDGLQTQAERLKAILDAKAKAASAQEVITLLLENFKNAYAREMEKALAIIDTQGRKDAFKDKKDKEFDALKKEFTKTAIDNLTNLQANAVSMKAKDIDSFIAGLTRDANKVMVEVMAKKLTDKFNDALSSAAKLVNGETRKTRFTTESNKTFNALLTEYKGVAANNLVNSQSAKVKENEIENFIKGLKNTAMAFAEVDKKAKGMLEGYKLKLDGAVKAAYDEIMGGISPVFSKNGMDDLKTVITLAVVKEKGKAEFDSFKADFSKILTRFIKAAESEGLSSVNAKAAEKEANDFLDGLPNNVRYTVNLKMAGMVAEILKKRCSDWYAVALDAAVKEPAQENSEEQKTEAIETFKAISKPRLDSKLADYIKSAKVDLCAGTTMSSLNSLFACLKDMDNCEKRLVKKIKAKSYFEMIAYLYVDMVMERIALNKDGVIGKDNMDKFKEQSNNKFSELTGVDFKDETLRKQFIKMGESDSDIQNIINMILKIQKRIEFKPAIGEPIYSNDAMDKNARVRDVWLKTEVVMRGFKKDAQDIGGSK